MSRKLPFFKYQGAGNDFILIEDLEETFPLGEVPRLCHRQFGIGADGLILVRTSRLAYARMLYFNADGSAASMCGNGLRCLAKFLYDERGAEGSLLIEIGKEFLTVKAEGSKISTQFPEPIEIMWEVKDAGDFLYLVDTGVPHVVLFPKGDVDIGKRGKAIRARMDANVNFVWPVSPTALIVRTFERGVEGETLACGSGVAASAYVAHKLGLGGPSISVTTKSNEVLEVRLGNPFELVGPAKLAFQGTVLT